MSEPPNSSSKPIAYETPDDERPSSAVPTEPVLERELRDSFALLVAATDINEFIQTCFTDAQGTPVVQFNNHLFVCRGWGPHFQRESPRPGQETIAQGCKCMLC